MADYREMWRAAAKAMDGTFTELGLDLWQIDAGGAKTCIQNHQMEFDNPVALALVSSSSSIHCAARIAGELGP